MLVCTRNTYHMECTLADLRHPVLSQIHRHRHEVAIHVLSGEEFQHLQELCGQLLPESPVPRVVRVEELWDLVEVGVTHFRGEQPQEVGQMAQHSDPNLIQILEEAVEYRDQVSACNLRPHNHSKLMDGER